MANSVKSCVPQKENAQLYIINVQSTFEFNADTDAEYMGESASLTEVIINYKLSSNPPTRNAGVYVKNKNVSLYTDWHNLPTAHITTTNLFQNDGTTLITSESMDTKDGPVLR
jgi:hypothetical protein